MHESEINIRQSNRIEWVDIFKALTIISVVVGHATGLYNSYIYQFHMAAFFFISGYTTKLEKQGFFATIWDKLCTIILPLITVFLMMLGLLAVLNFLFPGYEWDRPFTNIKLNFIAAQFFLKGNMYISWLGATWFLNVLVGCFAIQKILHMLSRNRIGIVYIIGSILLFATGYYMALYQKNQYAYLDLILIAQFYLFSGILVKKSNIFEKYMSNNIINALMLLISSLGLYYFGVVNPNTVDYPERRFGFIVTNYLAAMNGTLFIYVVSYYLTKLPSNVKEKISFIGQNTLCIVFFHFIFFKVSYLILYTLGIVPLDYVQNFIPTAEVGSAYYLVFVSVSILLSIVTWKILNHYKWMRILLGGERLYYKNIFSKISSSSFLTKLNQIYLECKNKVEEYLLLSTAMVKRHPVLCLSVVALVILVTDTMIMQGVICNDELQRRFSRMHGFKTLLMEGISLELAQGRPMRILAPMQNALSFLSINIYIFRSVQVLLILSNITLFGYFIFKLFNNKRFALLTTLFILVFLPITFEHTLPNAFVGLTAMPMNFLLLSFICFINYIEEQSKKKLFLSLLCFGISMLGYEFMVTFILLYPALYYGKAPREQWNIKNLLKYSMPPAFLGVAYMFLAVNLPKFFSAGYYDGVKIGFVSIGSSFKIIWTLFKSSLPGYYLFNSKYAYLFNLYTNSTFSIPTEFIKWNISGQIDFLETMALLGTTGMNYLQYFFDNFITMRSILFSIFLFIVLFILLQNRDHKNEQKISKLTIIVGLAYMIIPSLPNSIVKLYQGNVSENFYTGLPVSYFLFFSGSVVFCYLLWEVTKKIKNKYYTGMVILLLCVYCSFVQSMNATFAHEQNNNYQRMLKIEQLFDTGAVQSMKNQSVHAPDLYVTKNLLSVHKNYWTELANFKGLNVQINNEKERGNEQFVIYEQNNEYFVLCGGNEVIVLSDKPLKGILPVKVSEELYTQGNFELSTIDGDFYSYSFLQEQTDGKVVLVKNNNSHTRPFEKMYTDIGSTLESAQIIKGYHKDGWVGKESALKIRTQKEGKIAFKGYYPGKITGNEMVTIIANGNVVKTATIDKDLFEIEVATLPNADITVEINNNFTIPPSTSDSRQLSFILSSVQGM